MATRYLDELGQVFYCVAKVMVVCGHARQVVGLRSVCRAIRDAVSCNDVWSLYNELNVVVKRCMLERLECAYYLRCVPGIHLLFDDVGCRRDPGPTGILDPCAMWVRVSRLAPLLQSISAVISFTKIPRLGVQEAIADLFCSPKLKVVDIRCDCIQVMSGLLVAVAPHVEALTLIHVSWDIFPIPELNFTHLKDLNLLDYRGVKATIPLRALLQLCSTAKFLAKLHVSNRVDIDNWRMVDSFFAALPALKRVHIEWTHHPSGVLGSVNETPFPIEELNFSYSTPSVLCFLLPRFPNLNRLVFHTSAAKTTLDITTFPSLLKYISCCGLTWKSVECLTVQCPLLTKMDLYWTWRTIDLRVVEAISRNCVNLSCLKLMKTQLSDLQVLLLSRLPRLSHLGLFVSSGNLVGLQRLCRSSPTLSCLSVNFDCNEPIEFIDSENTPKRLHQLKVKHMCFEDGVSCSEGTICLLQILGSQLFDFDCVSLLGLPLTSKTLFTVLSRWRPCTVLLEKFLFLNSDELTMLQQQLPGFFLRLKGGHALQPCWRV
ncbi:hypothetical protein Pelo_9664 [Pelomyxa schiedti]|nr:hypothetical protein Pelo_9664 [Pelomyxa schiedti]